MVCPPPWCHRGETGAGWHSTSLHEPWDWLRVRIYLPALRVSCMYEQYSFAPLLSCARVRTLNGHRCALCGHKNREPRTEEQRTKNEEQLRTGEPILNSQFSISRWSAHAGSGV